jgi:DNA polymerase
MTLNLSTRQLAMLEDMGIVLHARSPKSLPALQKTTPLATRDVATSVLKPALSSAPAKHPRIDGEDHATKPLNPQASSQAAPTQELQTLNWKQLQQCSESCAMCHLGKPNAQRHFGSFVFDDETQPGLPAPMVRWLLVADAPTGEQTLGAQVMSQAAMSLLKLWFKALDLGSPKNPSQAMGVYLTCALKCAVTAHESAHEEDLLTCRAYLKAQIQLLQPQVILVMGRMASQALLANTSEAGKPLGKVRGQVLSFENTPMVITFSPDYLLHATQDKSLAWHDLCLAHSLINSSP